MIPRLPSRGTQSLSLNAALGSTKRRKRKVAADIRLSQCDAWVGGGGPHYHSRHEHILRGLAKLKAKEAAKASQTEILN